ncbi:MAG: phosphoribosylformylglycinamidine synthase subunit PurL [Planctomycetia bacterium]
MAPAPRTRAARGASARTSKSRAPARRRAAARPPAAKPAAKASTQLAAAPLPVLRRELRVRVDLLDPAGRDARAALAQAGLAPLGSVRVLRTYFLEGPLDAAAQERAAAALADRVLDAAAFGPPGAPPEGVLEVTVMRRAGVSDPEAETARRLLQSLGLCVAQVKAARTFRVETSLPHDALVRAAARALGNEVIEEVLAGAPATYRFPHPTPAVATRVQVALRALDGEALLALSRRMGLSLSRVEMEAVQAHFRRLRREPTDVELETVAQTWSEHCKHKTLGGAVRMTEGGKVRTFRNLLKETVFAATQRLAKPWCWSVFKDNAGVIDFDGTDGVCMKVETHNHPSAIEPYGGAGTGIGGVIRDILGTGLGARPVANTDVFCFGPPGLAEAEVPKGCMHPLRLLRGVVSGVRDYGNRMGIPTVNGAIVFDPRYVGNPVVYAGCVGILPRRFVAKAARPGDLVVAFGGRTGRDGIHGATFSSEELSAESETVSSGAVQIGDAITEKKVLDVLLQARDRGWFHAVTDCGAGGFSSAVGEMGAELGAEVDLAAAPLKYPGLKAFEVWISEAQERMVAAVPPRAWKAFQRLCASEDVEAVALGRFTRNHRLVVRHGRTVLADLSMEFLHEGLPRVEREACWTPPLLEEPTVRVKPSYDGDLAALLGMPQVGSKEWVVRQYDHEVQSGAVVRPFMGAQGGPSDAAVLAPKLGSRRGIVLANGINPAYGDIDPWQMALLAVDEALRNAVAVGADPARVAILDNFTWGSCTRPETLGALVKAAEGCRDAALLYGTPFISGKDSLNNEFRTEDGRTIVVPPTLLVSALGVIADVRKTVTQEAKQPGSCVVIVGSTRDELGGGHWYRLKGQLGARVPTVQPGAPRVLAAVSRAIRGGLVRAAHDLSEGGLAVAAAEMAFSGSLGLRLDLAALPCEGSLDDPQRLFSESPTRFLLEVDPAVLPAVARLLDGAGAVHAVLGTVTEEPLLRVRGRHGEHDVLATPTDELRRAWRSALPVPTESAE